MAFPGTRFAVSMLSIPACTLALAACGGGSGYSSPNSTPAGSPAASAFPLASTPVTSKIEGTVFTFQSGAIGGAEIEEYHEQRQVGFFGFLKTDGVGQFVLNVVPDFRVWLFAVKDGLVQPCGASVDARSDQRIDLEMVTTSSLDSLNPPLPQFAADPAVTGTIFEMTTAGRVPVVGAEIYVQTNLAGVASTRSDRRGGFYLCKLPNHIGLLVVKEGYVDGSTVRFDGTRAQVFDIELKRR